MTASAFYTITDQDIKDITALGFVWHHTPPPSADSFIMDHFLGFHPLKFLKDIGNVLGPLTACNIQKHIFLSDPPPSFDIRYFSDDYKEIEGLMFQRTFALEPLGLTVYHDYLVLPKDCRGKGFAKKVLAACLEQYLNMSVVKIKVHAGLEDGGYVWAKAGFMANDKREMEVILNSAKVMLGESSENYTFVKIWYDHHYNNTPDMPFNFENWLTIGAMEQVLRVSDWHGEIDLTNPIELSKFTKYVSRQTKI